jgi:peptide/nickel transport system permease protein
MTATPMGRVGRRRWRAPARLAGIDATLAVVATLCAVIVLVAVCAPLIVPYDPTQTDILHQNLAPSSAHLLGTDALGRDIFSRLIYGARLSLLGPALVTASAVGIGTALAITCAWFGGTFDRVVARVLDLLFAFPSILLAIIAVAVFGEGLVAPVIALAIAYIPYVARIVRSVALRERHQAYVDAAQSLGFSGFKICVRHILPNVGLMIVAQGTFSFASAIMDLAGISFIGLGVQPPASDWGLMVSDGASALLNNHVMETLSAGGAIVITVVLFNLLGERLSTASQARQ